MTSSRSVAGGFAALALWLLCSAAATGQTRQPPPPKEYDVQIRFRIRQPMPMWLDRFDELLAYLSRIGFVRDARPEDEPEDPEGDRLTGHMPSATLRQALLHPYVQTVLAAPRGYKAPAEPGRVKVNLELATGFAADRQHVLFEQVLNQLDPIGFREMVGYDHRGFTRVFGTIGADSLGRLLRDLRTEPSGWLTPRTPLTALPTPIRNVVPVRLVEVLPEPNDVAPAQEPAGAPVYPPEQAHVAKISQDLRAVLAQPADEAQRLRVEVVLQHEPPEGDRTWERGLRIAVPGSTIEGRFGTVATVLAPAARVAELARPTNVLAVRLPRSGQAPLRAATEAAPDFLNGLGLSLPHRYGYQGQGIKVAVISGDFGGWRKLVGTRLPATTRIVDMTTQRNPDLFPDPMPSGDNIGQGTLCAAALMAAAPRAELVLVRVDPAAPHQLLNVARLINGDPAPDNLQDRLEEISRDTDFLNTRHRELLDEHKKATEALTFEEGEARLPELRKRYEESQARLKRVQKDLEDLKVAESRLRDRVARMLALRAELDLLQNVRVVVNPLVWEAGHPLDGAGPLSRYLDERPFVGAPGTNPKARIAALRENRYTLWVQAAGETRGQTWAGLFRDADSNGAMEFVPATQPLGPDRWTHELNFLAWQPYAGMYSAELPEKARLRVTIQWREPHDPRLSGEFDDPYREPLAPLNVLVLRQRDPSGTKLGTDDLEVAARTSGLPVRLFKSASSGIYEHVIEFDVRTAGRYALRVEGRVPESTRPAFVPTLPSQQRSFELRPRILVEVLDGPTRGKGRVVFLDHAGASQWPNPPTMAASYGGVGMPADARNVVTVGGADAAGRPSIYGTVGAGPLRELLVKPDLLGYETVNLGGGLAGSGSALAAALDGGTAACIVGMGGSAQPKHFLLLMRQPPNTVLRIPEAWFERSTQR